MVDVEGRSVEEENLETSPTIDSSTIDSTFAKASSCEQDLTKQVDHDLKECSNCSNLYSENLELKKALEKSTQLVTADKMFTACSLSTNFPYTNSADKIQNDEDASYRIPKEKHDLLIAAMKDSREFCSVMFDKNRILVHAESDISRGDDDL